MERCAAEVGGSGSLGIDSTLKGDGHFVKESEGLNFCVGDITPTETYVHVLTDVSLNIVLQTLDTVTDFLAYLTKKEQLLRRGYRVIAAGEEDLMALYLKDTDDEGQHDFTFPRDGDGVLLEDGHWEHFCERGERARQVEADRISYLWDELIEKFAYHARAGSQYFTNEPGIENTEHILRFMAREPRTARRSLSKALAGIVARGQDHGKVTRYVHRQNPEQPWYVLMALAKPGDVSYERYRDVRLQLLQLSSMALKMRRPEAQHIVGIATEPGIETVDRSEDAIYFDARGWTEDDDPQVRNQVERLGILAEYEEFRVHESEYPSEEDVREDPWRRS